jgi:hypothetical protein
VLVREKQSLLCLDEAMQIAVEVTPVMPVRRQLAAAPAARGPGTRLGGKGGAALPGRSADSESPSKKQIYMGLGDLFWVAKCFARPVAVEPSKKNLGPVPFGVGVL